MEAFEIELDADTAPITVTNFVKLAQDSFYDGLTFWRIIDGFMMQGGDPERQMERAVRMRRSRASFPATV